MNLMTRQGMQIFTTYEAPRMTHVSMVLGQSFTNAKK